MQISTDFIPDHLSASSAAPANNSPYTPENIEKLMVKNSEVDQELALPQKIVCTMGRPHRGENRLTALHELGLIKTATDDSAALSSAMPGEVTRGLAGAKAPTGLGESTAIILAALSPGNTGGDNASTDDDCGRGGGGGRVAGDVAKGGAVGAASGIPTGNVVSGTACGVVVEGAATAGTIASGILVGAACTLVTYGINEVQNGNQNSQTPNPNNTNPAGDYIGDFSGLSPSNSDLDAFGNTPGTPGYDLATGNPNSNFAGNTTDYSSFDGVFGGFANNEDNSAEYAGSYGSNLSNDYDASSSETPGGGDESSDSDYGGYSGSSDYGGYDGGYSGGYGGGSSDGSGSDGGGSDGGGSDGGGSDGGGSDGGGSDGGGSDGGGSDGGGGDGGGGDGGGGDGGGW